MFAHPLTRTELAGLFGNPEIEQLFASEAMLDRMVRFEAALTSALGEAGIASESCVTHTLKAIKGTKIDVSKIREAASRDGVVVPELVRQLRARIDPEHAAQFHKGATSQDLVDTALAIALKDANALFESRLQNVIGALENLRQSVKGRALKGRTRMQEAVQITAADRIDSWTRPLAKAAEAFPEIRKEVEVLQFGGPVGDRGQLGSHFGEVAACIALKLGLAEPGFAWHSERARLADYASWCSKLTGSLAKIGQDLALMAQMGEVEFEGGGSSSAMPHKSNPVGAETMVALGRFNAVLLPGMHHSMVHEQERSGAAWSLEWMVLPQMCVATGAALTVAESTLRSARKFASADS